MEADVTHPGKCEDENCPSMAGVVATCDNNFIYYLPSARLQDSNTEFIAGLRDMVVERLEAYKVWSGTGAFPDHILFYRDGVSESQYGMVYDEEIPLIRGVFTNIAGAPPNWDPKITLLVVGKRHNARFFPYSATSPNNLPAGSVIDKEMIHPRHMEFYLQSHDSPIGTAKTGHYVVIVNESGYDLGELEAITNKLCFTGSRATTGLSICTPARYADILCDRLRCYMNPILNEGMRISTSMPMTSMDDNHLNSYRQNETVWVGPPVAATTTQPLQERNPLGNPWRKVIEDYMFYL
ncbi:hypothetical protein EAF04_010411 [Stromatinia cepivora]|nr:hypothetical protein EAF04_010411 [Stromatinia cepivora]